MLLQCCASQHDDQAELVNVHAPIHRKDYIQTLNEILKHLAELSEAHQRIEAGNSRIEQALNAALEIHPEAAIRERHRNCGIASQPIKGLKAADDPPPDDVVLSEFQACSPKKGSPIPFLTSVAEVRRSRLSFKEADSAESNKTKRSSTYIDEIASPKNGAAREDVNDKFTRTLQIELDVDGILQDAMPTSSSLQGSLLPSSWPRSIQLRAGYDPHGSEPLQTIHEFLAARTNIRHSGDQVRVLDDAGEVPTIALTLHSGDSPGSASQEMADRKSSLGGRHSLTGMSTPSHSLNRQSFMRPNSTTFLVFHPSSLIRVALDSISLLALGFDMFVIPFILAWDINPAPRSSLSFIFWLICTFWTLDLICNFRTGFFRHGDLEMRPAKIAKRYFKTWFFIDFAIILADWVSLLLPVIADKSTDLEYMKLVRLTKATRLLRLFGLMRIAKFKNVIERILDLQFTDHHEMFIQIPPLLLLVVWVNHLICCAWFALGRLGLSDTGMRWVDERVGNGEVTYKQASRAYQYVTSFHWALTQMTPGSMDVHARNTGERAYNNICLILGVLFFGSLISMITSKMTQLNMMREQKSKSVTMLRRFLLQNEFPQELRIAVLKQIRNRMAKSHILTINDVPALSMLSVSLRNSLRYQFFKPSLIIGRPLLFIIDTISSHLMHRICSNAVTSIDLPGGDNLFLAGTDAEDAYMLRRGQLRYVQEPTTSKLGMVASENVEAGRWVSEAALWVQWVHVGTVEGNTMCEILAINANNFMQLVRKHALVWQLAQEYAIAFHKFLIGSKFRDECLPSDTKRPFNDFNELLLQLNKDIKVFLGLLTLQLMHRSPWYYVVHRKALGDLQTQVLAGTCTLGLDDDNEVVRVVAVTALQLRAPDGRLFAHLGQIRKGKYTVKCQLPGTKQKAEETPDAAIATLISQKLAPLAESIQIESSDVQTSSKASDSFHVPTKYIRTVFEARLPEGCPLPNDLSDHFDAKPSAIPRNSQGTQVPDPKSVMIVECGDTSYVGAWLWDAQIDDYHTTSGQKKLDRWFESLPQVKQAAEQEWATRGSGARRNSQTSKSSSCK